MPDHSINAKSSGGLSRGVAPLLLAGAVVFTAKATYAEDAVVYKCPGPPVLYTDQITREEAAKKGCTSIEGAPLTVVPPQGAPHLKASPPTKAPGGGVRPKESVATRSTGSGFLAAQGVLVTNNHVVDRCDSIQVSRPGGVVSTASVLARDRKNDLALLRADPFRGPVAKFRAEAPRAGESVIALGFPYNGLLSSEANVSTGTISALAGIRNDPTKVQIQAPVQPGNSGGPLLDSRGAVVGVVVAKLDAFKVAQAIGDIPQNVNFAVKGPLASALLASKGIEPTFADVQLKAGDVSDVVERNRASVFLIECRLGE